MHVNGYDRDVERRVGFSGGWQQWSVDLSAWTGQSVEVSIAYASDWSVQGVGAFIDDITYPGGATESFESNLGGWAVAPAPPGSAANANTWTRTDPSSFPVGNSITTPDTVILGFGIEGVTTADKRTAIMGALMGHLLN